MKRNPNGYGSVVKLSGNRSRPWMVRVTVYDAEGHSRQRPIGYAETEARANILLAEYNHNPWNIDRDKITLAEMYRRWKECKSRTMGASSLSRLSAAYNYCAKYYGTKYRLLRAVHMQDCVDSCPRGAVTKASIKLLFSQLDRFAYENDIIDKPYAKLIVVPAPPETKRKPFTEEQIDALWELQEEPWTDTVLMLIYTGFRISEFLGIRKEDVNLEERTLKGGMKTAAGKNRIVPIHTRIYPFVCRRMETASAYLIENRGKKVSDQTYRTALWPPVMERIGAVGKVPHETRHTFETRLDAAGANRRCIDLMMGHSSPGVGNRVYNHKNIELLREAVALLR